MQQHHACSIGQQAKGDAPTWEGSTRLHEPLTQLHSCRRAGRRTRARHGEEMLQRGIERGVRCEACPSSTIHIPHTMTRSRHAQHTLSTRGEARRLGSSSSRGGTTPQMDARGQARRRRAESLGQTYKEAPKGSHTPSFASGRRRRAGSCGSAAVEPGRTGSGW